MEKPDTQRFINPKASLFLIRLMAFLVLFFFGCNANPTPVTVEKLVVATPTAGPTTTPVVVERVVTSSILVFYQGMLTDRVTSFGR